MELKEVAKQFKIEGNVVSVEPYGEGHINRTYLLKTDKTQYILQHINSNLFKRVDKLMNNIKLVTEFNRKTVIARGGNPDREVLTLVNTLDDKPYFVDGDKYYRVYIFINNATAFQVVENADDFYASAVAFGNFANLLADFDASQLYEVLPNFHNTVVRYNNFMDSLNADKLNRAKDIKAEIEFVKSRKDYCSRIVDLLESKKMPLKVTHNDTKLNNVMIDNDTHKAVAVIDLDTIMPGSICYDFGDSIRFGCNPVAEDEVDLSKVNFRLDLFEVYAKGYLSALGKSVTKVEKDNLAFGAILMTLECGIRFLADYLDGDVYFRTHRDGQNLDRARVQFKLVSDMEKVLDKMNAIVDEQYNIAIK